MKEFLVELLKNEVIAIVAMLFGVPAFFIGIYTTGYLWQNVIEPKLNGLFKKEKKTV